MRLNHVIEIAANLQTRNTSRGDLGIMQPRHLHFHQTLLNLRSNRQLRPVFPGCDFRLHQVRVFQQRGCFLGDYLQQIVLHQAHLAGMQPAVQIQHAHHLGR